MTVQAGAIVVGALAALATLVLARRQGSREGLVWAIILIAMQAIYVGFSAAAGADGLLREGSLLVVFALMATAGLRVSAWLLPLGYLAHGGWDLFHLRNLAPSESYAPALYPELCVGYDWLLFFYLLIFAAISKRSRRSFPSEEATA